MSKPSLQATEFSLRGVDLQSLFESVTRKSFHDFKVSMTPPEQSTGGGLRALQHITLTSRDDQVLLVGSANTALKTAELRTLGHVLAISRERYGLEIDIPPGEYLAFLERATRVLEGADLVVSVTAYAKKEATGSKEKSGATGRHASDRRPRSLLLYGAAMAFALAAMAAGLVWFFAR